MFPRFRNTGLTIRISKNAALKILLIFGSIFGVFLMTGLLYFRNDVEIIDENEKRIVYTVSADPYEILRENHITLGTYDRIDFTGFEENVATATLTIERAFDVDILEGGKKTATAHSVDATVAQLLEQAGVKLGEYDKVSPAKTAVLKEGQKIAVTRAYDVKITEIGRASCRERV